MTKFPTPAHLAAWAGVAPGSNESAGRQRSGRTRKGNAWLKTALVQAAHGAARMQGTALAAKYRRVAARRGAKRAVMAVAHRLLIIADHVIARREPYRELGADYLEHRRPSRTVDRLVQQLRDLGVEVSLMTEAAGCPGREVRPSSQADNLCRCFPSRRAVAAARDCGYTLLRPRSTVYEGGSRLCQPVCCTCPGRLLRPVGSSGSLVDRVPGADPGWSKRPGHPWRSRRTYNHCR